MEQQIGKHSPPPYVRSLSERTACLERDLYHVDQNVQEINTRMVSLMERMRTTEAHMEATVRSIDHLEASTKDLVSKVPDIAQVMKILAWLFDLLKYIAGLILLMGAASGAITADSLKYLIGL